MKIAFPKKQKEERIVVIAVNCCFDTVITQDLIRKDTVHGNFSQIMPIQKLKERFLIIK